MEAVRLLDALVEAGVDLRVHGRDQLTDVCVVVHAAAQSTLLRGSVAIAMRQTISTSGNTSGLTGSSTPREAVTWTSRLQW